MAQRPPLADFDDLVEICGRIATEIVHAHATGDDRTTKEIGAELLRDIRMPDMRPALQRLREADLDRALDESPELGRLKRTAATVLNFRYRRR